MRNAITSAIGISAMLVAIATGPAEIAAAQAQVFVTECVAGERVMGINEPGELVPTTVLGAAGAGKCKVLLDDLAEAGPLDAPFDALLRQRTPEAPERRALEIGSTKGPLSDAAILELRSLAPRNSGNARVYMSRVRIEVDDSSILSRICGPDYDNYLCKKARQQFYASAAINDAAIDKRNARAAAAERASSSEPVNSGYYQSGQYSRDVASGRSGSTTPSPTSSSAPVKVQSETEIRRNQERCRTGAGAC